MQQVQSYYSVIMRGDFSIYEMRIFMCIVRRAQPLYNGRKYSDFLAKSICADGVNLNFALPLKLLVGGRSHNYAGLKNAIRHMEREWIVEFYDKEKKIWSSSSVIYNVQMFEAAGIMTFSCSRWLIDYIADLRNGGYRLYDFEKAMSLRNKFSARLYLLMCSQAKPVSYSLDSLRQIMGIGSKYQRASDFIRHCIIPASDELEKRGFNGFSVQPVYEYGSPRRGSAVGVKLIPVRREGKALENISVSVSRLSESLPATFLNYLLYNLHFSWQEIKGNEVAFSSFVSHEDWPVKLQDIVERCRKKGAGHGYIVAAIKHIVASR